MRGTRPTGRRCAAENALTEIMSHRILLVDDEPDILEFVKYTLVKEGYEVFTAQNGAEALKAAAQHRPHLILLDMMMPVMDGITATSKIREFSNAPIILLTAKSEDTDKVLGLNMGADDYVTKPFNPVELLARVRSQLRRYMTLGGGHVAPTAVTIGGVSLDDNAKTVTVDGDTVNLTPLEYDILRLLMQHPGKVFSPHEIYRRVWHEDPAADNPVAVHVRHIREKIEINPAEPRYLKVVWGKGYKMEGAAQ